MDLYKQLFNTNLNNINYNDMITDIDIKNELKSYDKSCSCGQNYVSNLKLENWGGVGDDLNNKKMGWSYRKLYEEILRLKPKTLLEAGAGGGINIKILYSLFNKQGHKTEMMYCVENAKNHYEQILENIHTRYTVNKPHIRIPEEEIRVFHDSIHRIPLPDNSIELVFSHAVLAHIPYIPVIKVIQELARISSKYIFHIEHKNTDVNIQVSGYTKHKVNKLCLNYPKIYNLLGFKTLIYEERVLDYNNSPTNKQVMCIFLGQKDN